MTKAKQPVRLKPTGDRKTKFWANQKNTFGLLPGPTGTCPGCTTGTGGCWTKLPGRRLETCYVANTMNAYPNVRKALEYNTMLMQSVNESGKVSLLDREFSRFVDAERRRSKRDNVEPSYYYRLHWAGDVFDVEYARALASTMQLYPSVQFWAYTRSFFAVPILAQTPNLTLYLSLDACNAVEGILTYAENRHVRNLGQLQLCYMGPENTFNEHLQTAKEILEGRNELRKLIGSAELDLTWMDKYKMRSCPVDEGKLALEGGCANCKKCTTKKPQPVWFKS